MQLSEIERMEFWRLEMLMENHKEAVEEENKRNKTQQEAQKMPSMDKMMGEMTKTMGGSMPKMPTGFK
jgi:hypothetical protein